MNKKTNNDFIIGFEAECIMDARDFTESQLTAALREIHPGIRLDDDGSIEIENIPGIDEYDDDAYNELYTAEIVTPPLPAKESFEVLNRVFKLISKAGYTNESCGLHVNVSPADKSEFKKMNLLYIAYHPIFDEIAKMFDRQGNDYCLTNQMSNTLWLDVVGGSDGDSLGIMQSKDAAVNFDYVLRGFNDSEAHIEVRAFGNENYHRKLTVIRRYVGRVLEVFRKSKKYNFDYMTK